MIKASVIIEKGSADIYNRQVDLDGLEIKDFYYLTENYDNSQIIGEVSKVYIKNGFLMADIEIEEKYMDYYPSIGFVSSKTIESNNIQLSVKSRLENISLTQNPNVDETIVTIFDQLK